MKNYIKYSVLILFLFFGSAVLGKDKTPKVTAVKHAFAKEVYIPNDWKNTNLNIQYDLVNRSKESTNFVIVWGPLAGNDPTVAPTAIRFNPQRILDSLENVYQFYITNMKVIEEKGNLAKYKIIIVINNTWRTGLYEGWAFGGGFDNTIGAMYVDPRSMDTNFFVISHEMTHTFQYMVNFLYPGHGFTDVASSGSFWETHANFMALQRYPGMISSTDLPRAINFTNYYIGSPRKHYADWYILQYLKDRYGIDFIGRIWKESNQTIRENWLETIRRLLGFTQVQMNDMMYTYATKRIKGDFTNKTQYQAAESALAKSAVWRKTQILDSIGANHYAIPDGLAPQQYGFNTIRLYPQLDPDCTDKYVYLNFKSHVTNTNAGWRYGFVSVATDATITYGDTFSTDREVIYKVPANSAELYLVVLGAPTTYIPTAFFEVGFPKLNRYPYELTIKGAAPEGYQANFRHENLPAGARHANGRGFVASTASVDASAYVGPNAVVLSSARVEGTARIEGKAEIRGVARVSGNAVVGGFAVVEIGTITGSGKVLEQAQIYGGSSIDGTAVVKGNAVLFSAQLSGSAQLYGNAYISATSAFSGTVKIGGDTEITGTCAAGTYLQVPGLTSTLTTSARQQCDGLDTHELNVDVNTAYTLYTAAQVAFSVDYKCGTNLPGRSLTFPDMGIKKVNDANFNPGVTSTSNETIIYTSSNLNVAVIENGLVKIVGAGFSTITATVAANASYANKPTVQRELNVVKAAQTVKLEGQTTVELSAKSMVLTTSSSSGLPVSLTLDNATPAYLTGNTLLFNRAGQVTVTASQLGNNIYDIAIPATLTVTIVNTAEFVKANKMVSPNGDNKNDYFNLEGIEKYPENKVSILSGNGAKVFNSDNYDNNTVVFSGNDNKGKELPAGTYFYVIQVKDGDSWKVIKGYFALVR